jgi:uncharacterized membrane protein
VTKMEASVDVKVPASTAYNQWTQFEEFPRFMQHVERVRQIDDRHLHWEAKMAGKKVEWDAEIVEQIPDKRIAWRSTSGAHHAGVVTFHRLADDQCRVMLQLEWEPYGADEKVGSFIGLPQSQISEDLDRFAGYLEQRGRETGAWRGRVPTSEEARERGQDASER